MCIAILAERGARLSEDWLHSSFYMNDDGAGFAYIKDGKVTIEKGIFNVQDFIRRYGILFSMYGKDNAMLLHCRIATAGKVDKDNCHPFPIRGGAMIHNGHLWSVNGGHEALKSDTREFAETFYNILDYDSVTTAIDSMDFTGAIGQDKMAFLYDDGSWALSGDFYEESGVHFSNTGYRHAGASDMALVDTDDMWNYHNWGV